jgi:hypothetical protein
MKDDSDGYLVILICVFVICTPFVIFSGISDNIKSQSLILLSSLLSLLISFYIQSRLNKRSLINQFRTACLDKRLQAAQEAFAICYRLRGYFGIHNEHSDKERELAFIWWENNNLYLSNEVRKNLRRFIQNQPDYTDDPQSKDDVELNNLVLADLKKAVQSITDSVGLINFPDNRETN